MKYLVFALLVAACDQNAQPAPSPPEHSGLAAPPKGPCREYVEDTSNIGARLCPWPEQIAEFVRTSGDDWLVCRCPPADLE